VSDSLIAAGFLLLTFGALTYSLAAMWTRKTPFPRFARSLEVPDDGRRGGWWRLVGSAELAVVAAGTQGVVLWTLSLGRRHPAVALLEFLAAAVWVVYLFRTARNRPPVA
jgi:hypothetical protein